MVKHQMNLSTLGWSFYSGLKREHVPARRVLRSLLQVGGVFCRTEGLTRYPLEIWRKKSREKTVPSYWQRWWFTRPGTNPGIKSLQDSVCIPNPPKTPRVALRRCRCASRNVAGWGQVEMAGGAKIAKFIWFILEYMYIYIHIQIIPMCLCV